MEIQRINQIKKELTDCMAIGTKLSNEAIEDLLDLLEVSGPAEVIRDTTPMIGTNPFKTISSKSDEVSNKDINQSLNYRVSKFNDFE
jgi:hypothetical protein